MRGKKRLEEIKKRLLRGVKNVDPKNAKRYDIKYEPLSNTHPNAEFLPPRGYQFLLVDKKNPNESYEVMNTTYGELIRPYTYGWTPAIDKEYSGGKAFEPTIKKGIEYLRKTKKEKGRTNQGGLEKAATTILMFFILGGIFFLSSNLTGNAVANMNQSSGNILGAVLLVVGLVACFFLVKKK